MSPGLLSTSYRRKMLDADLLRECAQLAGLVVDLGGEELHRRGTFRPPQKPGLTWININIDAAVQPHIVADVAQVPLRAGCAAAVVCTELLEHALFPEQVIQESGRLLRPGGRFILSMPFMFPVHGDPEDYQRYTAGKLHRLLVENGFQAVDIQPQGFYFTVLADLLRAGLGQIKTRLIRWPLAGFIWPLTWAMAAVDQQEWARKSSFMTRYTTGYFVTAIKDS